MSNEKQAVARGRKMAERAQEKMDRHFPDWPEFWIWSRRRDAGYISIPRILPLAMQAIDAHAAKGSPSGHTLFCLWARSPDHVLLTIEHPATFAVEAGFRGNRAVDTWRKRMKVLRELGFIVNKKGPSGDFHYVLLINPIAGVERMHQSGQVQVDLYERFLDRLADTGAISQLEAFRVALQAQRAASTASEALPLPSADNPPPVPEQKVKT